MEAAKGSVSSGATKATAARATAKHPMIPAERRILVLYVGGTIGMRKNAEGALEPVTGYLSEQMRGMNELQESSEIAPFDIIEYEQLLDSSDMNNEDYSRIAADVHKHYDDYDGFLIAHGTDTMHFTASALSFLLYNLAKPVIVTGAMVPLAEPFNDARRNLVISMMIASNPQICEVCIFFNDSLFRGNRCDKIYHTYGAFKSNNYPELGVMTATHFVLKEEYLLPQPTGAMSIMSDLRGRVMCLQLHPDADVDMTVRLLEAKEAGQGTRPLLDGVVLLLNGVGDIAGTSAVKLRRIGEVAKANHIVACVAAREIRGSFNAKEVARLRAICPYLVYVNDMLASTAEVKMMYLFGKGMTPEQVAAMMPANLRGEVTPPAALPSL